MNIPLLLEDLARAWRDKLDNIETSITALRETLRRHAARLDAHDAALRSDSTEIADLAARVERLEGAAAPPPDPVEPPDPIDPTPPPPSSWFDPVDWASELPWSQIADQRMRVEYEVDEPGRLAAQLGLRELLDMARDIVPKDRRNAAELVLILPPGECGGLKIASESIHAQGAVGPELGDFAALHVIAARPPRLEAVVDADSSGPVKVHPSTALGMCERSALNMQRRGGTIHDFRIAFYGIELRCGDRTGVLVNTGGAVGVEEHHCSMSIAPGCDPASVKWGHQLYRYGLLQHTVSANLAGNREHFVYGHVSSPSMRHHIERIYVRNLAAQAYQWTARPHDIGDPAGEEFEGLTRFVMRNAIIRDCGQHAGKAGSALTIAGAASDFEFEDVLVIDTDATDTIGTTKEETYGGITVWAEPDRNSKGELRNYRPEQLAGRANGIIDASGLILAGRKPNRPLASFRDCGAVTLEGSGAYVEREAQRGEILIGADVDRFDMDSRDPKVGERPKRWAAEILGEEAPLWVPTPIKAPAGRTYGQPGRGERLVLP